MGLTALLGLYGAREAGRVLQASLRTPAWTALSRNGPDGHASAAMNGDQRLHNAEVRGNPGMFVEARDK